MDKWTLLFDVERCNGCSNCVIATRDEYADNRHIGYAEPMPAGASWFDVRCTERGSYPAVDIAYRVATCQHCDDPPCAKPVPGAVRKRSDGIVVIDPVKARGARSIVDACPYGAVHWNEELQLPQHWNFDAHLLDSGWNQTRGAQACPTGALTVRKISDSTLQALCRDDGWAELRPELKSQPRVYYKNLHRVYSIFIAGTVVMETEGSEDVVEGAIVRLLDAKGMEAASGITDGFGDFRFDGLTTDLTTACTLDIAGPIASGSRRAAARVSIRDSAHVGKIMLGATSMGAI